MSTLPVHVSATYFQLSPNFSSCLCTLVRTTRRVALCQSGSRVGAERGRADARCLFTFISIFIGPESDHWECLSLTDWLTHWLTDSVTFSRLELMAVIRFSRLEKKLLYISTASRGCQTLKRRQMCDLKLACHRMWEILLSDPSPIIGYACQ